MKSLRRWFLILPPYLWLLMFFALPFLIVFKISLSDTALSIPPYTPQLQLLEGFGQIKAFFSALDIENYAYILDDDIYFSAYANSVRVAFISTIVTCLIGYPIAFSMASAPARWKPLLVLLVSLPFWTSFLIRIYAWMVLLAKDGVVNHVLVSAGLIDEPLKILNTTFAVYFGMVYAYLPLMVFPIYATLEKLDVSIYEAARDLGCTRAGAFFRVTLPLSRPGVLAGCFLVFVPATGEFVVPTLLGSATSPMIGRSLWQEFFVNKDWPLAAAIAVVLLAALLIPIIAYQAIQQRVREESA